jgi:Spy/CpxP family protein refolding chaperone
VSTRKKGEKNMNHIRSLAIGSILIFAPVMLAQQTATEPGRPLEGAVLASDLPDIGNQLKVLTEKLDLTADQQPRIKAIIQELHDATQKIMQDKTISRDQLLIKVRPLRMNANSKMREILSDEQKKKLDQYLQGPHPDMHGTLQPNAPHAK